MFSVLAVVFKVVGLLGGEPVLVHVLVRSQHPHENLVQSARLLGMVLLLLTSEWDLGLELRFLSVKLLNLDHTFSLLVEELDDVHVFQG